MQIRLDALGGVAGDMFVAALLDAFPEHEAGAMASIAAAIGRDGLCRLVEHNDGVFRGRRFEVDAPGGSRPASHHDYHHHHGRDVHHHHEHHHDEHDHHHGHGHDGNHPSHAHASWASVRARLQAAPLDPAVRDHAIAIFALLAEAEGRVHGVPAEAVQFHEVGAEDSIADIVGAAHLIAAIGAERWLVSALPLGSGRVRTAHGLMPVPTPATVILLEGFRFVDDGAPGERVTPTGAAILRHLCDPAAQAGGPPAALSRSGVGFGTRVLPGMSNCLRALVFDEAAQAAAPWTEATLSVLEFEIDDQSAEDLALGLDRLRAQPGVVDVVQAPAFGKKGRMMTQVRLLVRPEACDEAIEAAFRETSTIGLRRHDVRRAVLPRRIEQVEVGEALVRVKTVDRPGGRTAKADADDARSGETHAARQRLRRDAEGAALGPEETP